MLSTKRLTQLQIIVSLTLAAMVTVLSIVAARTGVLTTADNFFYDLHLNLRGSLDPSGDLVLVAMDEKSAAALSRHKGSWSRRQLADAIGHLSAAGAEIIGLDLILTAPDVDPEVDRFLAQAIEKANNVILARVTSASGDEIAPLEIFQEAMIGDGFIDVPLDEDEVLRKIRFFNAKPVEGGVQLFPSFSLELVRTFLGIDFEFDFSPANGRHFKMGAPDGKTLLLPYPELLINYRGLFSAFDRLSYVDIVNNTFDARKVKGKIIILGSTLATQKDFFTTPFSRFHDQGEPYRQVFGTIVQDVLGDKEPGMSCHAHAVETILSGEFLRKAPFATVSLLMILAGIVSLLFYIQNIGILWEIGALLMGCGGIFMGAHFAFLNWNLWIGISGLLLLVCLHFLTGILSQRAFSKRKTAMVTSLFGKYVSPGVVEELLKGDIDTNLEGRRENLTVLFSDLRSFTTLSETLGARDTSRLLNVYFDAMIPLVFKYGGTLDKLIGDAVMAFFGAPVRLDDHPEQAARSALDMLTSLAVLKREKTLPGIESLEIGIGLNSGIATVGNLGSHHFMDYTIIGDTVNFASRLEGLNKFYGTRLLISQFCADGLGSDFLVRTLDRVRVKGKENPVTICELRGYHDPSDAKTLEALSLFEEGRQCYQSRRWQKADTFFDSVLELWPHDRPTALYMDRIRRLEAAPPGDDWEPVETFTTK